MFLCQSKYLPAYAVAACSLFTALATSAAFAAEASALWSLQPLAQPRVPAAAPEQAGWQRTPVDAFVSEALHQAGLTPSPEASRARLVRRLYFDVTGLPPSLEAVADFVDDTRPDAYEQVVEELLASPQYGERWARHWLDVARYADSGGYEFDFERPNAYHYRDFVITALNQDMPFNTFVQWQIAGDEYAPENPLARAATGFTAAGPTIGNQENEMVRYEELDDILSTTASAFLGLTVGCARCHDHKFDPIPTRDYYRMLTAFTSTRRGDFPTTTRVEAEAHGAKMAAWDAQLKEARQAFDIYTKPLRDSVRSVKIEALPASAEEKALLRLPFDDANVAQKALREQYKDQIVISDEEARAAATDEQRAGWDAVAGAVAAVERAKPPQLPVAFGTVDATSEPAASFLLTRGNPDLKEAPLTLGYLSALPGSDAPAFSADRFRPEGARSTYQRTALAEWLTSVEEGAGRLTARVIVNRVWQHHFGEGLVRTPNDFGTQGDIPSHPALLDWLAGDMVEHGWSLKHLHRRILNSTAYRQDSAFDAAKSRIDPQNRLLWRMKPARVEAEVIRDAMLAVSGCLNPTMYGPGVYPFMHPDAIATGSTGKWPKDAVDGPGNWRRSVYVYVRRSARMPMFESFDAPDVAASCARRITTTVPSQALAMMNSEFVQDQARRFAWRVLSEAGGDRAACVARAYELALVRQPGEQEMAAALRFLEEQTRRYKSQSLVASAGATAAPLVSPEISALEDYCQVLLSLNEFVYIN